MELKDIKADNYYVAYYYNEPYPVVIKAYEDGNFTYSKGVARRREKNYYYYNGNSFSCDKNIRLATEEEIHWLNCCIEQHKFIKYDEAMLTFEKFIKSTENLELIYKRLLNVI